MGRHPCADHIVVERACRCNHGLQFVVRISPATTKRTYPDHAVLNATKTQLKAMPEFDYSK